MISELLIRLSKKFEKPNRNYIYKEKVRNKANYLLQDTYSLKSIEIQEKEIKRLQYKLHIISKRKQIWINGEIMRINFNEWNKNLEEEKNIKKEIEFEQIKLEYMKQHQE